MRDNFEKLPAMHLDQEGTEDAVETLATVLVLVGLLVVLIVVAAVGMVYRGVRG